MPQAPRRNVDLSDSLVRDLDRLLEVSGVPRSTVIYVLWRDAARCAAEGHGHLLPQEARAPRGSVGPVTKVRWSQSDAEYDSWVGLIVGAGSTPTAAVRAGVEALVAAGGNLVTVNWPPRPGRKRRAVPAHET